MLYLLHLLQPGKLTKTIARVSTQSHSVCLSTNPSGQKQPSISTGYQIPINSGRAKLA